MESLFCMLNGDDLFTTFVNAHFSSQSIPIRVFSVLYLVAFIFIFIYIVLSLFIGIFEHAYESLSVSMYIYVYIYMRSYVCATMHFMCTVCVRMCTVKRVRSSSNHLNIQFFFVYHYLVTAWRSVTMKSVYFS